MATFTSADAFAKHINSYGKAVGEAQKQAVAVTAAAAAAIVKTSGSRYHIKGRRVALGAKVGAVTGSGASAEAAVQATPIGAWVLIEEGAKPHPIRPRRGRRVVVVPGLGVFAHVQHPGTGGPIAHPWKEAMEIAGRRCPDVFGDAVVAGTLRRVA